MRFATWNVNSIRTRVDRVIAFLQRSDTDVLAMQEIKCRPDQFPIEPFEKAGYHVAIHGLNQWNGVAVASRLPILDIQDHFPTQPAFGEPPVVEARALGVTIDTTDALPSGDGQASSMTIWSLYVPNGRELTHAHYAYKLQWLANLAEQGRDWLSDPEAHIALVGDWNVAPLDEDVWDMSVFEGATHVSAPEREAFAAFAADGWVEVTRDRGLPEAALPQKPGHAHRLRLLLARTRGPRERRADRPRRAQRKGRVRPRARHRRRRLTDQGRSRGDASGTDRGLGTHPALDPYQLGTLARKGQQRRVEDRPVIVMPLPEGLSTHESGAGPEVTVRPHERTRLPEVPNRARRRVGRSPVRSLLATNFQAEAPRAGRETPIAGHDAGERRKL